MYHVPVDPLAERVLSHIRRQELLSPGDRVGLAVSGGIDSVALLRLLLEVRGELGIVVSLVHFNHKLRGAESDADQEFVAGLARQHDLEFHTDSADVAEHAAEENVSLEAAARELRYAFFRCLLDPERYGDRGAEGGPQGQKPVSFVVPSGTAEAAPFPNRARPAPGFCLDKIVTGHTLDDQAETVLLRIIRGAGLRGLGAIHPRLLVGDDDGEARGEILRPLLPFRHRELKQYLKAIGQLWREDSTNTDECFTRNRLRKRVVPLLEQEFNPAVAENLAELAEIARGEEDYWDNEVAGWMGTTVHWSEPEWAHEASNEVGLVQIAFSNDQPTPPALIDSELQSRIDEAPWLVANASLSRMWFLGESIAVQRRVVKAIGERAGVPLEFKHVENVLRFAVEDGGLGKELSLPFGWKVVWAAEELRFLTPDLRAPAKPQDYEYELPMPGRVIVAQAGLIIAAQRVPVGANAEYNPEHLLDADSLPGPLRVRNWRPGDRFWPAHTKSPKKIKELLQERHVAQPERRLWPVVVSGDEIVWVWGFPSPTKLRAKPGQAAVEILEKPLVEEPAT